MLIIRSTCPGDILEISDAAQQVIVLSRDADFLKLLWDGCSPVSTTVKTLQMAKTGDTTIIGEWDRELRQGKTDEDNSMIPKECKRLAEVEFLIAVVSEHLVQEKSIQHGRLCTPHVLWGVAISGGETS